MKEDITALEEERLKRENPVETGREAEADGVDKATRRN